MGVVDVGGYLFYRSVLDPIGTNMYTFVDQKEAVVVDPHPNKELFKELKDRGVMKVNILLTHEHPDHTLGVPMLRSEFSCELICHEKCAKRIADARNNRPLAVLMHLAERDKANGTDDLKKFNRAFQPYTCHAEHLVRDKVMFRLLDHEWAFVPSPGHSEGGCCIEFDNKCVFTGDNLILGVLPIFRFDGGCEAEYMKHTKPYLDSIADEMMILPGHGSPFKMLESRRD